MRKSDEETGSDQAESRTVRMLRDLESGLRADLERFRYLADRNRTWRRRRRELDMKERLLQMRRCVELRAGGRSGVRIAARVGIALRTLRRWEKENAAFRTAYIGVYERWKADDDEAVKVLLASYHPERQATDQGEPRPKHQGLESYAPRSIA